MRQARDTLRLVLPNDNHVRHTVRMQNIMLQVIALTQVHANLYSNSLRQRKLLHTYIATIYAGANCCNIDVQQFALAQTVSIHVCMYVRQRNNV